MFNFPNIKTNKSSKKNKMLHSLYHRCNGSHHHHKAVKGVNQEENGCCDDDEQTVALSESYRSTGTSALSSSLRSNGNRSIGLGSSFRCTDGTTGTTPRIILPSTRPTTTSTSPSLISRQNLNDATTGTAEKNGQQMRTTGGSTTSLLKTAEENLGDDRDDNSNFSNSVESSSYFMDIVDTDCDTEELMYQQRNDVDREILLDNMKELEDMLDDSRRHPSKYLGEENSSGELSLTQY